jgi:hypothetical protein
MLSKKQVEYIKSLEPSELCVHIRDWINREESELAARAFKELKKWEFYKLIKLQDILFV